MYIRVYNILYFLIRFTITQFLIILCCYDCTQDTFDINNLDLESEMRDVENIVK